MMTSPSRGSMNASSCPTWPVLPIKRIRGFI
jgi:hypothetical protein